VRRPGDPRLERVHERAVPREPHRLVGPEALVVKAGDLAERTRKGCSVSAPWSFMDAWAAWCPAASRRIDSDEAWWWNSRPVSV
jgi:hypothetical protein